MRGCRRLYCTRRGEVAEGSYEVGEVAEGLFEEGRGC